jgi:site-specific recombinase XerD
MKNKDLTKIEEEKCQWKSSSIGIVGIDFPTKDIISAGCEQLSIIAKIIDEKVISKTIGEFFENMINEYPNRRNLYKIKNTVGFIENALKKVYNNFSPEMSVERILSDEVIIKYCELLPNNSSRQDYKKNMKLIIQKVFSVSEEILKLNPFYCRLINIITYYDYKPPHSQHQKITVDRGIDHPIVADLLEYITQKNGRNQRHCKYGVRAFLKWLCKYIPEFKSVSPPDVNVRQITRKHIQQYQMYLETQVENKEFSISHAVTSFNGMKKWFEFMRERGLIIINPVSGLHIREKRRPKKPFVINLQQMQAFLEAVYLYSVNPLMDLALFGLYICTGVRSVSALGTRIGDFNSKEKTLKVILKGGNEHIQCLPSIVVIQIERYLQTRLFKDMNNWEKEPLCVNANMILQIFAD